MEAWGQAWRNLLAGKADGIFRMDNDIGSLPLDPQRVRYVFLPNRTLLTKIKLNRRQSDKVFKFKTSLEESGSRGAGFWNGLVNCRGYFVVNMFGALKSHRV